MAPRILVVDDEQKIRRILDLQLSSEGFDVDVAANAKEAYKLLVRKSFDVVISDVMMAHITGKDLLEYVIENHELIPVIMLTGVVNVEKAVDIMRLGAFDYLVKPVKKEDLILTINKALRYRELEERKRELERKNKEYQQELERKVEARTRELQKAFTHLRKVYLDTIRALTTAIEAKDPYLNGHSYRVSQYALALGKALEISRDELRGLELGALLHDIGKISIDNRILHKKAPLVIEDIKIIQQHPIWGERIIEGIDYFDGVRIFVRHHHERYDGKGYPDGLKGEQIPYLVNVLSVVDAFDAMTSDRSYRKALKLDDAVDIIGREVGEQFHPGIVKTFLDKKIYKLKIPKKALP